MSEGLHLGLPLLSAWSIDSDISSRFTLPTAENNVKEENASMHQSAHPILGTKEQLIRQLLASLNT
jgi:hypothetical protein